MTIDTIARGLGAKALGAYSRDALGNPTGLIDPGTKRVPGASVPVLTDPSTISGLTLWLDAQQPMWTASYAAQCAALTDVIGIWPDQSGNTNEPTVTGSPLYDPTGINGRPAVKLNGGHFTTGAILSAAYASAITVFVVARFAATPAAAQVLFGASTGPSFWMGPNATSYDVTIAGLTGWGAPTSRDALDGVYSLSVGAANAYFEHRRNSVGLGCSVSTLGKAITGSIAFTGNTATIGSLGSSAVVNGWIGEVLLYNAALTPEQIRQVRDYLSAKWGYSALPFILCSGDSVTSGTGSTSGPTQIVSATGDNYPSYLLAAYGAAADVRTDAYPGRTLAQLIAETNAYSGKFLLPSTGKKQIEVVWCGSNTLTSTRSPGLAYKQFVRYCQARRALGFKIVAVTCMNRADSVYANFNTDRQILNANIRSNLSTFADAIADVGADARFADPNNTTYFASDKVHLISNGYSIVAGIVKAAVDPLL